MKKTIFILTLLWATALHADACPPSGFDGALCRGHALLSQAKYNEASLAYVEAEKLALAPFETMLAITFQARTSRAAGQTEQALALYQKGYDAAGLAKAAQGKWINLNEMAGLLLAQNEGKKALAAFLQGYTFAANDNERAESNRLIASAYKQLADYDRAIEHQLKSSLLEQRSGDLNHYLLATLELAALRTTAKSFVQAQRNLDEAMSQAKAVNSDYWQAVTLLYQSRLESAQNQNEKSAQSFAAAKSFAKLVNDLSLNQQLAEQEASVK